jgi:TRAP-type C4-dicarboxylate transport system permease large subunit
LKNLQGGKQTLRSSWALATILIVAAGVAGGVFTATESAVIAVIYSLFVSVAVYRGLNRKGLRKVLGDAVNLLSVILILICTSCLFGFLMAYLKVPVIASSAIKSITDNPIALALLLNLILLILGCVMDMAPIILIATPILPIAYN